MITVTYCNKSYECATALRGANYIHLLDENGVMIAAFDGITNFVGFTISGGSWTVPASEGDCPVAVIREDGSIGKGTHKCSDIANLGVTYTVTLPTTSGGEADWQSVDNGYQMVKSIPDLTESDVVLPSASDELWVYCELDVMVSAGLLTIFVTALPDEESTMTVTITKTANGGAL